ncbi:hypothetical protein E2C01_057112 [Portunus trituberculatus]|uniref:Uncharacterized protein n=1 Tax=Portunus trituberculatus TaxID=210409 RepID=A0A5B7GSK9_PORTR|nr:hypothetical protein [Portunus trituberculatus]
MLAVQPPWNSFSCASVWTCLTPHFHLMFLQGHFPHLLKILPRWI